MSRKTDTRAHEILQMLLAQGRLSVEELTDRFATSSASIRRDLVRLEERGLVHRTHGGVMPAGPIYEPFRFDASFPTRETRFVEEKQRIAAAAAALVREGETIGITAGTTTTQVARALRLRSGIHIVTNAVNIGMEMSAMDGLETTLTGGCLRWKGAFSLVGPAAVESLNLVVLDKLFLGVCGVHPDHGATTIQAEEAAVFRAMRKRAKQIIVVADSSKLGQTSPSVVCSAAEIDLLITDAGITREAAEGFARCHLQVMVVDG